MHVPDVHIIMRLTPAVDFHPDEYYKAHSSTAAESACHSGNGPAGMYGAETSDCDTPYTLVNATFDWIRENIRDDIDFVIWTGDSARHDSDESIPRSPAQVQDSNEFIASKFIDLFKDPSGRGLTVPVIPTLGNNDILPHNVLLPGPNKWLKRYTGIWKHFIPQEQRHSFEFGGWFYVEVIPNRLAVFSLNSLYFFDRNAGVDDCVNPTEPGFKQLEWLRIQLQFMRERGVKAILMGHVPPARTGSKQLWDETCWQKYTLWLRQYRDVIVGGLYGHMNIDHFMLQDAKDLNYNLLGDEAFVGEEDDDDDFGDDEFFAEDTSEVTVRAPMEDEMDIKSTADYLQELRSGWAKLPKPTTAQIGRSREVDAEKKRKRKKKDKKGKKGGNPKLSKKWSERYQLSFVAPSIVPNYLPSLRVMEYNISGLEEAPIWTDGPMRVPFIPADDLLAKNVLGGDIEAQKKKKKAKKDKNKGKKDPNLVVPEGPSKTAGPGPAYSPQTLTLLGYTQYFANLTYINNDMTTDEEEIDSDSVDSLKWRQGKHGDKEPKKGKPHTFQFKVEYSTFTDKIYGLSDMTVNSLLEMAYRMGKKTAKAGSSDTEGIDAGVSADVPATDDVSSTKTNKVWLHFLRHAFVSSVSPEELEKLS